MQYIIYKFLDKQNFLDKDLSSSVQAAHHPEMYCAALLLHLHKRQIRYNNILYNNNMSNIHYTKVFTDIINAAADVI